ncbi:hypothetical protein LQZ19_05080 [Treponema primitia]|uniref:hypothetical protein n=1 Tax=Treponema primitia TaxID=88058 RepID=UPI00397F2C55
MSKSRVSPFGFLAAVAIIGVAFMVDFFTTSPRYLVIIIGIILVPICIKVHKNHIRKTKINIYQMSKNSKFKIIYKDIFGEKHDITVLAKSIDIEKTKFGMIAKLYELTEKNHLVLNKNVDSNIIFVPVSNIKSMVFIDNEKIFKVNKKNQCKSILENKDDPKNNIMINGDSLSMQEIDKYMKKQFPDLSITVSENEFLIESGSINGKANISGGLSKLLIFNKKDINGEEGSYTLKDAIVYIKIFKKQLIFNKYLLIKEYMKIKNLRTLSKVFILGIFIDFFKNRIEQCRKYYKLINEKNEYCSFNITFKVSNIVEQKYAQVIQAFAEVVKCDTIWSTAKTTDVDWQEKSYAKQNSDNREIESIVGNIWLFQKGMIGIGFLALSDWYYLFYPAFIFLYIKNKDEYHIIDYKDLKIEHDVYNFIADYDKVPSDAKENIYDYTYTHVNRDDPHSPDRRFGNNPKQSMVHYYELEYSSDIGIKENIIFSNMKKGKDFSRRIEQYAELFK